MRTMRRFIAVIAIAAAGLTAGVVATPHAAAGGCPGGTVAVGATRINNVTYIICADLVNLTAILVPLH